MSLGPTLTKVSCLSPVPVDVGVASGGGGLPADTASDAVALVGGVVDARQRVDLVGEVPPAAEQELLQVPVAAVLDDHQQIS